VCARACVRLGYHLWIYHNLFKQASFLGYLDCLGFDCLKPSTDIVNLSRHPFPITYFSHTLVWAESPGGLADYGHLSPDPRVWELKVCGQV
jgi:hypothetical protein